MENQPRKITGYRELTEDEITLINSVKENANQLGVLIEFLEKKDFIDKRWLAIAKTDLQKSFMALIRAIAKPESF